MANADSSIGYSMAQQITAHGAWETQQSAVEHSTEQKSIAQGKTATSKSNQARHCTPHVSLAQQSIAQ